MGGGGGEVWILRSTLSVRHLIKLLLRVWGGERRGGNRDWLLSCLCSGWSHLIIVWFQKISIPPPRRELEIPEGWGGQWPRKFQRGGGVNGWISFQRVNFTFMSDIVVQNCNLPTSKLRRSFLKTLLCLTVLKKPLLH